VKIFTEYGKIWTRVQDPMCPVKTFTRHKFRSNPNMTRKTYHPFSQVITDNTLSLAILGLPNELPSVFSDKKEKERVATQYI